MVLQILMNILSKINNLSVSGILRFAASLYSQFLIANSSLLLPVLHAVITLPVTVSFRGHENNTDL